MASNVTARAVILNEQGQMLIVRRSATDPFHPGTWDIPGGQVEHGEDVQAAAIRETQEEVGLALLEPVLIFATSDMREGTSKSWLFYKAYLDPENGAVQLSYEHDEYKWVNPGDLGNYTDYDILLRFKDYAIHNNLVRT
jgi:8-oxo-dGTP diphosphatase